MKKFVLSLLIFTNICYADNLQPRFYTGNELLAACEAAIRISDTNDNSPYDALQGTYCTGYLMGVTDLLSDTLEITNPKAYSNFMSDSDGVTRNQLVRMTVNYLTDNPKYLNYSASTLVIQMLYQQYNIPSKK